MADEELLDYPLKVTIKGDGAAPWITAAGMDGKSTAELLNDVTDSGLIQAAAEVSALLSAAVRAVNALGAAGSGPGPNSQAQPASAGGPPSPGPQGATAPAAPSVPQGGGGLPYQVPPTPPQNYPQQPQYPTPAAPPSFNGAPHPEGLRCDKKDQYNNLVCGAPVVGKQTKTGKRLWSCPNQMAKGDGHYVQWLN